MPDNTLPRVVLTTRHSTYFTSYSFDRVTYCIRMHNVIPVEDDNGNKSFLNPTTIATLRPENHEAFEVVGQELLKRVVKGAEVAPGSRYGQRIYNALYAINKTIADEIRNTEADPYYSPYSSALYQGEDTIGKFFVAILDKEYRYGLSSST